MRQILAAPGKRWRGGPQQGRVPWAGGFSGRLPQSCPHGAVLWEDAERFVIADPSNRALIERIDNATEIRPDPDGPYRFRRFGFLGD